MAEVKAAVIPEQTTVCVTGANGFVASHLVNQLLQAGYTVHGTVRSLKQKEKYAHLTAMPNAAEKLKLFEGNLTDEGSYDNAIAGCQYVLHTASPFSLTVNDAMKDLVEPAVKGSENVLKSALKNGVKRVVLTSSLASVVDTPQDGHVYTEADWNNESGLNKNPYFYSKKMAEEAAWNFSKQNGVELVVINPVIILGPSYSKDVNDSNGMIRDIFGGVYGGLLDLHWGFVDVRDVARAHVLAMETPNANGRHLCCGTILSMKQTVQMMKEHFPDFTLPTTDLTGSAGNAVVKLSSYFQPGQVGQYLRSNIGRPIKIDNSKVKRELGLQFIEFEKTLDDTVNDLIQWGHINDVREYKFAGDDAKDIVDALKKGVEVKDHSSLLCSQPNTFVASNALDVISKTKNLKNRGTAVCILDALIKSGAVELTHGNKIKEESFLRFK